jgi:hypothetical protein
MLDPMAFSFGRVLLPTEDLHLGASWRGTAPCGVEEVSHVRSYLYGGGILSRLTFLLSRLGHRCEAGLLRIWSSAQA